MLAKHSRLSKREDFALVYNRGRFAQENGITIKYLQTADTQTRIGFAIGKKYSKKAVKRNHARRILRAACRPLLNNLKPGVQMIMMVRPDYQEISYSDAQQKLIKLLKKFNLFK